MTDKASKDAANAAAPEMPKNRPEKAPKNDQKCSDDVVEAPDDGGDGRGAVGHVDGWRWYQAKIGQHFV